MNRVIMQLWEESERGCEIRPDGCSLHISSSDRTKYINEIYSNRGVECKVPNEYDRAIGSEIEIFVTDSLFKSINGTIKITECEFNNLVKMEEIIIKKI